MCKLFIWKEKNIWPHIFLILHWHFVRVFSGVVDWDNITRGYYCVLFPFVCCFTPTTKAYTLPPPPPIHSNTNKRFMYPVNCDNTAWFRMHWLLSSLCIEDMKVMHSGYCVRLAWFSYGNGLSYLSQHLFCTLHISSVSHSKAIPVTDRGGL
jgi:hypothetical protein